MERIRTPPPVGELQNGQLLTPPPTGGRDKRVRFAFDVAESTLKRFTNFEKLDELSVAQYTEVSEFGDQAVMKAVDSSGSSGGSSLASTQPSSIDASPLKNPDELASGIITSGTPIANKPFPLMKLPLSIRSQIYNMLLVVPAIICVRQKRTSYHYEERAFLYSETRELLPGIAYALVQHTVDGSKAYFSRVASTNISILSLSKEVHAEAKAVMYGQNIFELVVPSPEMSPSPNFKIPLFPRGYQRLVRKLIIRLRSFYPAQWLVNGGYVEVKNAYRGLETLTLVFEMEAARKGYGRRFAKLECETWRPYVKRLQSALAVELFGRNGEVKHIPLWMDLRVLFNGDQYDDASEVNNIRRNTVPGAPQDAVNDDRSEEATQRLNLKRGLAEAFELFKKGGY